MHGFRSRFGLTLALLIGAFLIPGRSAPVQVDPATPLAAGYWSAGEWATNGNFDGWARTNWTASAVTGGQLTGTAGTNAFITLANLTNSFDLDLGTNDFIDLRLAVPAVFTGSVVLAYGVTNAGVPNQNGFASAREITVPTAQLIRDASLHTYRIDTGLEPMWRGVLRDLRVTLRGSTLGQSFALDYLRIGDVSGNDYAARISEACPAQGSVTNIDGRIHTIRSLESKRFRIIWSDLTETEDPANPWNATKSRGTLRNLEEIWQVFVKRLGYREPCFPIGSTNGPVKYKINMHMIYLGGTWAGPDDDPPHGGSFARQNTYPAGTSVDPPSWVNAHELMHVFQFHNTSGHLPGEWWECHANYGQERYLEQITNLYPNASGIASLALRDAHFVMASGRNYYLTWLLFQYLDSNPDALPDLGEGTVVKLWQQIQNGESPYAAIERLTPQSRVQDIIGLYARRGASLNYPGRQASLTNALAGQEPSITERHQFTELFPRPDDPGWWRVPAHKAPMQGAYTIHELIPAGSGAGRVVSVDFRGLPDSTRGAGWRASLVVRSDSGVERYSPLWSNGTQSVTLSATENQVHLVVAGTPDTFVHPVFDEVNEPFRSHPSRSRFPYEVRLTGASPRERNNGSTATLVQHANGGGWRSTGATVAASAYLGPNARVLDTAQVLNSARIEDFAVVRGTARVLTNAVVSGHALVRGSARVTGRARVRDWAIVEGSAVLTEDARVLEHATVSGLMRGSATAKGSAQHNANTGDDLLSGHAIVDGDYSVGRSISNGIAFGHLPYIGVPDEWIRPIPTNLIAAYAFDAPHDSRALDQYGVTDGWLVGAPAWISADARRAGFLQFNGSNQHVLLDRSVADAPGFTFTAWIKPLGGPTNQAVLWLGRDATNRLALSLPTTAGQAVLQLRHGTTNHSITSSVALPTGLWTHVAFTLNGTTGTLFLNGTNAGTTATPVIPAALLGSNTAATPVPHFLARAGDASQPRFQGALDEVRFYSRALTPAEILALQPPVAPTGSVAIAGTLHVDLRAAHASSATSAWTNLGTLGGVFTPVATPAPTALVDNYPAVTLNGAQAWSGPVTVADIHGGSDRSIEVWAHNPALSDEETVVSLGHRGSTRRNLAFNFGANGFYGVGAATHWADDVAWITAPSAGAWHHLVYTYATNVVRVYVDGTLSVTRTLGGPLDTFAGEPINIGCQRDSANGARSFFFNGSINTVRIHGGVLSAAQVSSNFALGPAFGPPNAGPSLNAIPSQALDYGTSTNIAVTVSDSDTPLASVALLAGASNATLLPPSGLTLTGTGAVRTLLIAPAPGQTGSTPVTVWASDGAALTSRVFNVTALSPRETWRRHGFGTWSNTGAAADFADPNADGEVNLLEFATGQGPHARTTAVSHLQKNGATLEFTYQRAIAALTDGLSFAVEWSDTLAAGSWTNLGVTEQLLTNNGTLHTVRASMGAGGPRRYLHLRIFAP